jgi:hypothetical protein
MKTLLEGVTLGCAQAHPAHPVAPLMRTRSARECSAWHLYGTRVSAREQRSATSVTLTVSVPGNGGVFITWRQTASVFTFLTKYVITVGLLFE